MVQSNNESPKKEKGKIPIPIEIKGQPTAPQPTKEGGRATKVKIKDF
jgi:hypothetical protein